MLKVRQWLPLIAFVIVLAVAIPAYVISQQQPHQNLTYRGPGTCLYSGQGAPCHVTQAQAIHASDHYQWQGHAQYITNGPGVQGKLHTAFNSY